MTTLLDLLAESQALTIPERFALFNERNPEVLEQLESMCAELVARGRSRFSLKTLVEVLRWNYWFMTDDPTSHFKLNNSYTALYARLIIERNPQWDGLFEMRGGER